jgi:hypothetical protein
MSLRRLTIAALLLASASSASAADDSAGVQILIDLQDPGAISNTFCVYDSKLYSVNAQICPNPGVKLVCMKAGDAAAAEAAAKLPAETAPAEGAPAETQPPAEDAKGVVWAATADKQPCR